MKFFFIIFLCIASFVSTNAADLARNHKAAQRYLKKSKILKRTISLGKLGWSNIEVYWDKVPELRRLRDEFEIANEKLGKILKQDKEFRRISKEVRGAPIKEQRKAKSAVYRRLNARSPEYRKARKKRDKALFTSNYKTLEYIIQDYHTQGKVFPIDVLTK